MNKINKKLSNLILNGYQIDPKSIDYRYIHNSLTGLLPAKYAHLVGRKLAPKTTYKFANYLPSTQGLLTTKPNIDINSVVKSKDSNPYLIGMEIEIEHKNGINLDTLENCTSNISGKYYVCNDGSLRNGAEVVTAPLSRMEFTQSYVSFYKLLKSLANSGHTAHDNERCGLHVHISRKYLSETQWHTLRGFVVKNSRFFKALSRRKDYFYCKFVDNNAERYRAVNLRPDNTAEFRFFRGTLKPDSFYASIETIIGLVEYFASNPDKPTVKRFSQFLGSKSYLKFAHKYCEDIRESLKGEKSQLSEAYRLVREQRRRDRNRRIISMLNRITSEAVSSVYTGINNATDPRDIVRVNIPVEIRGFNRDVRGAVSHYYTPVASININRSMVGTIKALSISRTSTWGRYSYRYRLVRA